MAIKAKKAVKEPKKAKSKGDYAFQVLVNGLDYNVSSKNLGQAVKDYVASPDFPVAIKTRVVIRCGKAGSDYQWVMPTALARRMFRMLSKKPEAVELFANRLIGRLD